MNDRLYPDYERGLDNEDEFLRPLKLLAKSIAFDDPYTGQERYFESKQELRLTGGVDLRQGESQYYEQTY